MNTPEENDRRGKDDEWMVAPSEEDLLMIEGAREFAKEALELAELALPAYLEALDTEID